jgi:hypothetical protein
MRIHEFEVIREKCSAPDEKTQESVEDRNVQNDQRHATFSRPSLHDGFKLHVFVFYD